MLTLTYDEFKKKVEKIITDTKDYRMIEQYRTTPLPFTHQYYYTRTKPKPEPIPFEGLFVEWKTGGVEGGSCWDDSNPVAYNSDDKPVELTSLDLILTELCPQITYLTFKKLNSLIQTGEWTENGYYGNYDNYEYHSIAFDKLYGFLIEQEIVENPDPIVKKY